MDYTATPSDNMQPGPANFDFLQAMYGTVSTGNGQGRNMLRKLSKDSEMVNVPSSVPSTLRDEVQTALGRMEQIQVGTEHLEGWIEHHRNEHGSLHSRTFGDDGAIVVRVAKKFPVKQF